jgi:hypothetical protein
MKNFESFNPETVKKIIHEKSKKPLLEGVSAEIKEKGISALKERAERYFEAMNIKPEYISYDGKTLEDLNYRLNTEGGIAISNHPGYVDIPAIINCLNREDIMIMIGEKYYPEMQNLIGDKYIIPASTDSKKLFSIITKICDTLNKKNILIVKNTNWDLSLNNEIIGNIKITAKKIILEFTNLDIIINFSLGREKEVIQNLTIVENLI